MIVVVSLALLVLPACGIGSSTIGVSEAPSPAAGASIPGGSSDSPPIVAVKDYLAATPLDGQQYSLSDPPFCELLPEKVPKPEELCMTIQTVFQESRADIVLRSEDGTAWDLVDELRDDEWDVTSATLAGSE